jgi:acetyl esterase/lipase
MYPFAEHFARLGLVGISVQYRLLNSKAGTSVLDCVKDGRSAVRFVRSHADSLGIDPEKIIVSGGSAGGHIAAGTALFKGVDEPGEPLDVSSVPNALVLLFPVIDTSAAGYGHTKVGQDWRDLSPVHQVGDHVPPTLIFHGTGDTVTPFAGAKAFQDAMHKAGNRCDLEIHEGGKHGYLMFDETLLLGTLTKTERFLSSLNLVPNQPVKKLILPGESFLVEDRPAFVLLPPEETRQTPQPWIMYAPTLPAYPDSHEKWMHEQFLAAGIAVAGIDAGEAYGSPRGQKLMTALYEELTTKRGFAPKPCLLGRSRGGLWVSSWAIANPEKVAGIAGIYPVFDLRTYPGLEKAAPAYDMSAEGLESKLDDLNPIARIGVLAEKNIPVCIIHGDEDKVVPLKENSAALVEKYKQANAATSVNLIIAEGQGHNFWEGFFRCQDLVDFAIEHAKTGTANKVEE